MFPTMTKTEQLHITLRVDANGDMRRVGLDDGHATLEIVYLTMRYLVLKVGGQMAWSGRGSRAYYPTQFVVYGIGGVNIDGATTLYHLHRVCEFDARAKAKTKAGIAEHAIRYLAWRDCNRIGANPPQEPARGAACRRCGEPASPAAWHNGYCAVCADQIDGQE